MTQLENDDFLSLCKHLPEGRKKQESYFYGPWLQYHTLIDLFWIFLGDIHVHNYVQITVHFHHSFSFLRPEAVLPAEDPLLRAGRCWVGHLNHLWRLSKRAWDLSSAALDVAGWLLLSGMIWCLLKTSVITGWWFGT